MPSYRPLHERIGVLDACINRSRHFFDAGKMALHAGDRKDEGVRFLINPSGIWDKALADGKLPKMEFCAQITGGQETPTGVPNPDAAHYINDLR